jgi:hypothetical protein
MIVPTAFPPTIKLEDHPLLGVRDCLFKILVTILSGGHFPHSQPEKERFLLKRESTT